MKLIIAGAKSAQYLLRVTSGGKIVRNFKILGHRFQNQVRSHNLGPSDIQNLPKYLSIQIKLALGVGCTPLNERKVQSQRLSIARIRT